MLGTMLHTLVHLILTYLCEGGNTINLILRMKKSRNREVKQIVRGHLAENWQSQYSNSDPFHAKA